MHNNTGARFARERDVRMPRVDEKTDGLIGTFHVKSKSTRGHRRSDSNGLNDGILASPGIGRQSPPNDHQKPSQDLIVMVSDVKNKRETSSTRVS